MALNNVRVVAPAGHMLPSAITFRTEVGSTVINAGEPCKVGGTGSNFAIPSADAEPLVAAPTFIGIASSTSTQTAAVDGLVDIIPAYAGMIIESSALSAAAVDTDAELKALLNTKVLFNLVGGVYTIDTAVAAAGNGLSIVGGDIVRGTIRAIVRSSCTMFN